MGSKQSSVLKTVLKSVFVFSVTGAALLGAQNTSQAADSSKSVASALAPQKASYGYFIDQYKKNIKQNTTPD